MGHSPVNRRTVLRGAGVVAGAAVVAPFVSGVDPAFATGPGALSIYWVGLSGAGSPPYPVASGADAGSVINAALSDAATAGHNMVFIAPGTYNVTTPIVIGDLQTLYGAGPASTILKAATGFPASSALIGTASGSTASHMCIRDLTLNCESIATNGINLQIASAPPSYPPDPTPWISRVNILYTLGDAIYLGGAYSGGMRDFKIDSCRITGCGQGSVGGWGINVASSDGTIIGCTVEGSAKYNSGGINVNAGNVKLVGCKVYSTGSGSTPGPGYSVASRSTLIGCEAQDTAGCGFEILGANATIVGCVADSTGASGSGSNRYSAGLYIDASGCNIDLTAFQRSGGVGTMKTALYLDSGASFLRAEVVSNSSQVSGLPAQTVTVAGTTPKAVKVEYTGWDRTGPAFQTVTTPPVAGTVYQNTTLFDWTATQFVSIFDAGDQVIVYLSPDGTTFTRVGSAGTVTDPDSTNEGSSITFTVPAGWYYKYVASGGAGLGYLAALG